MSNNLTSAYKNDILVRADFPHFIKYMGSKSSLIDYLSTTIRDLYEGETICDLFAGSATLSGALGGSVRMISNDIQEYSSVLARTYLSNYASIDLHRILEEITSSAAEKVDSFTRSHPQYQFDYSNADNLKSFQDLELRQQKLIDYDFHEQPFHLFTKYYSGTYWSYEQCVWIDAIRAVAEEYKAEIVYDTILSCLMFAMAYNAQSTGHYAQYRDPTDMKSMTDIAIYRNKEILPYFTRKFKEICEWGSVVTENHIVTTLDYKDCLDEISEKTIIYADPPYAFVHYSRFYHALETLVKYDYPEVLYKGRYRVDRHQSPFCKRSEVNDAFIKLFRKTARTESKLVLSYSNTGMISLEKIVNLAKESFGSKYDISYKAVDYTHSTMGRKKDKSRDVKEFLVIAKPKQSL